MPSWKPELAVGLDQGLRVCGVDEAGRGPWAGPVFAAALVLPWPDLSPDLRDGLADSKTLSQAKREALYALLLDQAAIGRGQASVAEIDDINILQASLLAMQRAVADLPGKLDFALIDGNKLPSLACPAQAIVKGDDRSLSIAAASIIAKVERDRLMVQLDLDCPGYAWAKNKGYGTKAHQAGLAAQGVTPHHRRSFAPIAKLVAVAS